MKLLTKANLTTLPALYANENNPEPVAVVKFFTPWSNWTWYAQEFDGKDTFFGLVDGFEKELGYFSLSELESLTGPFGLKVERDRYFTPTKIKDLQK
jgi:hypothetical protein